MPSPRKTEVNLPRADAVTRRYHEVVAPTSPPTEIFVGPVDKAEIQRLLKESADFREIILQISERAEFINTTAATLRLISVSHGPGVPLSPADRDLVKESLADIRVELKSLYSAVSEPLAKVAQTEKGLEQQKQALERQQLAGIDVTTELTEVNTRLTQVANEKAVLEEFFKAFSGKDLDYAVRLANKVRELENRRIEQERQAGIRTAFELLLNQNGVPILVLQQERLAELGAGTPENKAWENYYSKLSRHFLSLLLDMVEGKATFQYLDMGGNITKQHFTVQGEVSQLQPIEVVEKTVLRMLSNDIKISSAETKAAQGMIETTRNQLFALGIVLDKDDDYLSVNPETGVITGKAQTFDGIKELFPMGGTSLNPWMWETLFSIGALYWRDENGGWHEDDREFGKKIYTAFREILIRGRNVDRTTLKQDMYTAPLGAKEDTHKSDVMAARLQDVDGEWKQFKIATRSVATEQPVMPIKQALPGKSKDKRLANWYEVICQLTDPRLPGKIDGRETIIGPGGVPEQEADVDFYKRVEGAEYREKKGYHLDQHSAVLAAKLSNITGETDYQDSTRQKGKITGTPEGVTLFSQIMNVLRVIRKYTEAQNALEGGGGSDLQEQTVGKINEAIIIDKALWTFLDYFGYDGKTYTQHVIENDDPSKIVWGEVNKKAIEDKKKIGVIISPEAMGQGMHPNEAQQIFGTMVNHFLPVLEQMWKADFDLRGLMKINYETGTIEQVNVAQIDQLIDSLRKILDYFSYTESSYGPSVVQNVKEEVYNRNGTPVREKNGDHRKVETIQNPTGDMIAIRIQSSTNPDTVPDKTFVTRIHQIFPMHPMHLWRWIEQEQRNGKARSLPGDQQAGYGKVEYPDTDHGKRPKEEWVFRVPANTEDELPDPKLLLARENVYRFLYALIYPGNQKSSMDVSDWAVLMSVLTDEGYKKMEEGWWDGPISNWFRTKTRGTIKSLSSGLGRVVGEKHTRWLKATDQFLDKEIGSFKHRGIYPWKMGWQFIAALNDKFTFDEFSSTQSGLERFFSGKKKK